MSFLWTCLARIIMTVLTNFSTAQSSCESYRNVSEWWRNIGFCSSTLNQTDSYLTEGWYRFHGTAGDVLVSSCAQAANEKNVINYNLITCDSNFTSFIICSQGFTVYYLRPIKGIYIARHSSCSNISCGPRAHCGAVYGSCVCEQGLTKVNSTGCSALHFDDCQTINCTMDFMGKLDKILSSAESLPLETVTLYLDFLTNPVSASSTDAELISYGNQALALSEKLVSLLVTSTDTDNTTSIKLDSVEAQIFTLCKMTKLKEIPPLNLSNVSLKIDLIAISEEKNGPAAVVFIRYTNMSNILKPSFFNTNSSAKKILMSPVVSATLPNINSTSLTKPVNFTFEHTETLVQAANLSCVYWEKNIWVDDGCSISNNNSTHTMCSCTHLSTFALLMMTNPDKGSNDDDYTAIYNTLGVSVGLMFLLLTILTLSVCQRDSKITNVALLNLSISLFMAHLVFLLTQNNLESVREYKVCQILAGVIHFLFLSAFVWMFIEAVLLYICVKNLLRISSKHTEELNWKCMIVIGYVVPLFVVGVTAGLYPNAYTEKCWLKNDFVWSFLGPVTCIIAINLLLSCVIINKLRQALSSLDKSVSHMKHTRTLVFKTLLQFVILGCPWALGFFNENKMINIIFLFLNSQQGTFIFIVHCVLNQEIRQQYRKYWTALRHCCKYKSMSEKQSKALCSHSN